MLDKGVLQRNLEEIPHHSPWSPQEEPAVGTLINLSSKRDLNKRKCLGTESGGSLLFHLDAL